LLRFVGGTAGSWLGWWIGSFVGFGTAVLLSIVGFAAGLYAGRRVEQTYF
jgi:outer membrane lipoprotein SlyB